MRLLLIEDDPEAARFVLKGLREGGYTVEHAADGREGLFRATEGKYDAIITDRMLPHMDGLAIVQLLRQQGSDTPVLVLSALGNVDDRVRGLRAGGDDYLTKPFAFVELLARVEALLRRKAGRRNSRSSSFSCGARARWSRAPCCSRACGICSSTRRRISLMCISAACGRRSTAVSTGS
jgi:DNA-binding response OmpR family regulator